MSEKQISILPFIMHNWASQLNRRLVISQTIYCLFVYSNL